LVDLFLEDDSTSTYSETYDFLKKLLGDYIVVGKNKCHIDINNWEGVEELLLKRGQFNDQIEEAIQFMLL